VKFDMPKLLRVEEDVYVRGFCMNCGYSVYVNVKGKAVDYRGYVKVRCVFCGKTIFLYVPSGVKF